MIEGISSIGVDAVRVERMNRSLERHGHRFLQRVFTDEERRYCRNRTRSDQHYAARFAAKEAVMKLLGTGWSSGVRWTDISIERAEGEPPSVRLSGEAARVADNRGIGTIHVSLTHTGDTAIAFCVGEQSGGRRSSP